MHVYQRQFGRRLRGEEGLAAVVEAVEGGQEGDCVRGEVHYEVGDCGGEEERSGGGGPPARGGGAAVAAGTFCFADGERDCVVGGGGLG